MATPMDLFDKNIYNTFCFRNKISVLPTLSLNVMLIGFMSNLFILFVLYTKNKKIIYPQDLFLLYIQQSRII